MFDSEGFARKIDQLQTQGNSMLAFVIAGSLGPSKEVVDRSNLRWKLSDLTFTHQMTKSFGDGADLPCIYDQSSSSIS